MRETKLEKYLSQRCKEAGAECLNVHGHAFQRAGWPDHYFSHRAFTGWVEFKVGRNGLSPLQKIVVQRLRERGDTVLVVRFNEPGLYEEGEFDEVWFEIEGTGIILDSLDDGQAILRKFATARDELRAKGVIWTPDDFRTS